MVTSSLALVFKMSSLHVLYLLFPKSPRFLDWSINAVTGSLYVKFSWFLFIIFVVLCSLLISTKLRTYFGRCCRIGVVTWW